MAISSSPPSPQEMEIVCGTVPAEFIPKSAPTVSHPYDRIVSVRDMGAEFGRSVQVLPEEAMDERSVRLPAEIGERLLQAAALLEAGQPCNCHKFSRIMAGVPVDASSKGGKDHAPLTSSLADLSLMKKTKLAPGQLGMIGRMEYDATFKGDGTFTVAHSLVGLGEGEADSLQVLSTGGELGFVDTRATVKFYRRYFRSGFMGAKLYKLASLPSASSQP